MTYFITIEELKQTTFNANLDNEYIAPALEEAQSIYLREIIGDLLYTAITSKIDDETLSGKYLTLVDQYIKPYLTYKVQSVIVIPLNNKTRNAGVIQQYDQGFNTSTMKDTAYLADYYNSRAEFYANRLTTYLQKNADSFPEYGYSEDNITQPTESQNVTTIYLGGTRKKCNCNGRSSGGSSSSVDWNDIRNKPDFAYVATSGDYNDLKNQPNIPTVNNATLTIKQGGTTKGTFTANAGTDVEIDLEAGGSTDWNDITNKPDFATVATSGSYADLSDKPTIPVVPTNVSAFTNDAGYLTQHQSLEGYATEEWVREQGYSTFDGDYNSLTNKPTIPTVPTNVSAFTNDAGYLTQHQSLDGYATEQWVSEQGFSTFSGSYNDLTDKPSIPTVNDALLTIKQGGVTKGTFSANSNQNIEIDLEAGGSGSTDWSDIQNKPNFATVATSGDYEDLTNKPAIPTVPTNVSAFTNDAGYTTFDGDYNSLTNKPTIPAAQVQSDWNQTNTSEVDYIKNKPTIPVVPANVSAFNNDAGYLTQHQSLAGYATENWVQQQGYSTFSGSYNDLSNKPTIPAKTSELTNDSGFTTFDGDYNSLSNKPTIPAAQVQSDWNANSGMGQILNKPTLATVATSGDYDDLQNKPTIPAAQVNSDWNAVSGVAQILNKPTIPTVNDSTINIYQGSTLKGSFSLNQSSGQNINLDAGGSGSQVQSDWNQVDNSQVDFIKNKPTVYNHWFGTQAQYDLLPTKDINTIYHIEGAAPMQSDWNEADPTSMAYINNKPSIPAAQVQSDWNEADNTSMAYIKNKPTIPAAQVQSDWNQSDTTAVDYIKNKPSIPVVPNYTTETWEFTLQDNTTVTKTVYLVPSV